MKKHIKVGSRDSALAMWQTEYVVGRLQAHYPEVMFEIFPIKTKGDKILDVALSKIGDKGLFTKELEVSILSGDIDFAVHSLKDMPTKIDPELTLSAIIKRDAPQDAFVSEKHQRFADLPQGAKVGTSSLRRKSQLLHVRPDLNICDLRGNVLTRLRKMVDEDFDAIILAAAGLERLSLEEHIKEYLSFDVCLPSVSQGAIVVESRHDNASVNDLLQAIHDEETACCVTAERALLATLEGGCQIPIAAHATLTSDEIILEAMVGSIDGRQIIRKAQQGDAADPVGLGKQLAAELIRLGALNILQEIKG